jgi:hypothetical protein
MRTDGRTNMTKLIVVFRNPVNAPKKGNTVPLHAKQSQRVGTSVALHILNPNTGKGWEVSDMPRPFYTPGTRPGTHETSK